MRILVISQIFPCQRHPTSGIFLANLMKDLSKKVDKLIIITPRVYIPNILTKIQKKWVKWRIDPMISKESQMTIFRPYYLFLPKSKYYGLNGILMYFSLKNKVKKIIKNEKIELIIGHNILPEGIAALFLGNRFKVPFISWAIGSDIHNFAKLSKLNNYLTKKCVDNSYLVLTTSKELENRIRRISNRVKYVNTFYRGIDIANFKTLSSNKEELKKKLNLNTFKKYILFTGRLIRSKGIYELAETFITISKKYSNYNLLLIGEEIEKNNLIEMFKNSGLLDRICFKGIVAHKEVADYMKASELLIFPSWAEGLPNVVLEAMACGLPVVATEVGGIPEILIDGKTGLSVPVRNTERLTEAAIRMIEDKALKNECIKNSKKIIFENFDVKKNALHLYNILTELKNVIKK